MPKTISFTLNNTHVEFTGQGEENLLHVLRTDFNLTGTKFGCGEGYCGACTILVDNMAMRSCQMTIADVQGKAVLTIEGLGDRDNLDPVQNAFIEHDALQCGFCTPGMILNAVSLLKENPQPSQQEIIRAMDNNLCRCGAYGRIIEAIESASRKQTGGK
ncbi:2Fe-2S iron-sulfur cluster binding domain-containing protein [candidate division KSB1 bacterium]|nr:2Fe-2S iron-sulfur cluster binding domain-containing protein [candidate division KSB1 bacterium]